MGDQPGGLFYAKDVRSGGTHVHDRPAVFTICMISGLNGGEMPTAEEEASVGINKPCYSWCCRTNEPSRQ